MSTTQYTFQFRGKFLSNIGLIVGLVFITSAVFIMALAFCVAGHAQTPPPGPHVPAPHIVIITPSPTPPKTRPERVPFSGDSANVREAAAILENSGEIAEGSFYSCLLNDYMQGLPLKEALEHCSVQLIKDSKMGFGGVSSSWLGSWWSRTADFLNIGGHKREMFDPSKVSAACHSGDPGRGQSSGKKDSGESRHPNGRGWYSWGTFGDINSYNGLTKEQSKAEKEQLGKTADAAEREFFRLADIEQTKLDALHKAEKSGDKAAIEAAKIEWGKAYEEAVKAGIKMQQTAEEAKADPNTKRKPSTRTVGDETPCEKALQAAREILYECNRNGWTSTQCQQLKAKIDGCPDPTKIFVDPEQGYTCEGELDEKSKEALKDAWVKQCEERKRGVDPEHNPCVPPVIDKEGRYIKGKMFDVCNPKDPYAYVTPDVDSNCAVTFKVHDPGEVRSSRYGAVWALNTFGGPIFVSPKGGPEPPEPKPRPVGLESPGSEPQPR